MRRKPWLLLLWVGAVLVGGGVFVYASQAFDRLVATRPIVVAAVSLRPYTLVTADMLVVRELPRVMEAEAIYLEPAEVIGKLATGPIPAGALLYRAQLVAPAQFRLAPAELEVVSIPVDPARAVGGQIQIGHVVNVYRVAQHRRGAGETSLVELLATKGAAAVLLVTAPVVDVRDSRGLPTDQRQAASQIEREGQPTGENRPLQIVTLAVPPGVAQLLVELAVEQTGGEYELWLSLAPAGVPVGVPAAKGETSASAEIVAEEIKGVVEVAEVAEETVGVAEEMVTETVTPAPVLTAPPLAQTRTVTGTGASTLRLRAAPTPDAPVLTTLRVGTVVTLTGTLSRTWVEVRVGQFVGWLSGDYLSVP